MTGYSLSKRGRYKCDFCDHKSYKTMSGVLTHLHSNHELELEKATSDALRAELQRERSKPPKVVEKERIVYRDPPAKPEPKQEYWYRNVFCTTCKLAFHTGIPKGYAVENTRHSTCGTVALMPIERVEL